MEATVDGSKSLADQQSAIRYAEQANNARLTSYEEGTAPNNTATLTDVPLGEAIKPLTLIASPTAQVIADQKASGKELVFNNAVYVDGKEVNVAGFR